jgi:hypothetical protein
VLAAERVHRRVFLLFGTALLRLARLSLLLRGRGLNGGDTLDPLLLFLLGFRYSLFLFLWAILSPDVLLVRLFFSLRALCCGWSSRAFFRLLFEFRGALGFFLSLHLVSCHEPATILITVYPDVIGHFRRLRSRVAVGINVGPGTLVVGRLLWSLLSLLMA